MQIPEFRLEFGAPDTSFPDLFTPGVYATGPIGDRPYEWEVGLPGVADSGPISFEGIQRTIARYPALRGMTVMLDDAGQVRRSHNPGRIYLKVPPHLLKKGQSTNLLPVGAIVYRRHFVLLPAIGQSPDALAPLLSWWLALYALSMVARYSPSEWTSELSLERSPIASKIELVLDAAMDAVPELIAEALSNLNA